MVVENPLGHPQAESCSCFALGGDEWVEQALEHVPIHAGAAVGDGDRDALAPRAISCGANHERKASFFGQGIESIRNKVGENLLNLSRLAQNRGCGVIAAFNDNIAYPDGGVVKVEDGVDYLIERGKGGGGSLAIELQTSRGDVGQALEFLVGDLEQVFGVRG